MKLDITGNMVLVANSLDVERFAGKMVAFTVDKPGYFGCPGVGFEMNGLKFGVIGRYLSLWQKPPGGSEHGYGMTRIKLPSEVESACALIDSLLIRQELRMRNACDEEISRLWEMASRGEVRLEYGLWSGPSTFSGIG